MSYKIEVLTAGINKWRSSKIRYPTHVTASLASVNMLARDKSILRTRIVESADPVDLDGDDKLQEEG